MYRRAKILFAALVTFAIFPTGNVSAASLTGQQLLSLCTANMHGKGNVFKAAACMGFVIGVSDTFDCTDAPKSFNHDNSAAISQPRLVAYVVEYLKKYPAAQKREAHTVVGLALASHFPCQPTARIRGIEQGVAR